MSIFNRKNKEDRYHFKGFIPLAMEAASTFLKVVAKNTVVSEPEKRKENYQAAFMPFLNEHNIALLLNDENIEKLRDAIINKALPSLDKHYIIYLEPTADKGDVVWGLSYRPEGGKPNEVVTQAAGYLSQLNQATLFELIKKFMPHAPTATVQQ